MKKTLLAFATLVICTVAHTQNNPKEAIQSGTITYNETKKINFESGDDIVIVTKPSAGLPKESCTGKKLYFNKDATLYLNDEESENDGSLKKELENGATMIIHSFENTADNKIFTDLNSKKQIEQREFMTRLFLIERKIDAKKWKITGKQKTILDYSCQEAILKENGEKTTAWFTPNIPISSGPDSFYGLPGMILAIESNNAEHVITATSIDLTPIDNNLIEIPTKGKKITKEKFDKIVEKKKKENNGNEIFNSITIKGASPGNMIISN